MDIPVRAPEERDVVPHPKPDEPRSESFENVVNGNVTFIFNQPVHERPRLIKQVASAIVGHHLLEGYRFLQSIIKEHIVAGIVVPRKIWYEIDEVDVITFIIKLLKRKVLQRERERQRRLRQRL